MRLSKDELGNLLERTGLKGIVEELRPLPEKAYDLSADNPSLKAHIVQVYPKTLEDVRALVGTSLEDGRRHREQMNLPEYLKESCALAEKGVKGNGQMLRDIANRLVHFPCDETEELLAKSELYQEAARKVLEISQGMPVLLAENLVVNDGEVYTISVPLAVFDQIIIYGSGSIQFQVSQVKLSANRFQYYPNSKGGD